MESYSKLSFIEFTNLFKWHVDQYFRSDIIGKFQMVKLFKLLSPRKTRIKADEYKTNIPLVSKIRFSDGKLFYRTGTMPKNDVYLAKKGDLLVSNINFEKGAFCIIQDDLVACSTDYQPYELLSNDIIPDYLNLCLRCEKFLNVVADSKPKGMKTRARWDFIKTFSIPVPSIEEQQKLVDEYRYRISESHSIDSEYSVIDEYIRQQLSIENLSCQSVSNKILSFIEFANLYNWDIKNRSNKNILASEQFKMISLSQVAKINPSVDINLPNEAEISFVPMECVSDFDGEIVEYRTITRGTKGYTKFQDGDIIWAKITPCMQNGKCAIVQNMLNGFGYGSTEFHVIRVNNNLALTKYIYYILRMVSVREEAKQYFTGSAGQQRVNSNYLNNLMLPLPSLEVQTQLVQELDKLKIEIKQNRQRQINLSIQAKQDFENSIFG